MREKKKRKKKEKNYKKIYITKRVPARAECCLCQSRLAVDSKGMDLSTSQLIVPRDRTCPSLAFVNGRRGELSSESIVRFELDCRDGRRWMRFVERKTRTRPKIVLET